MASCGGAEKLCKGLVESGDVLSGEVRQRLGSAESCVVKEAQSEDR